MKDKKMQKPLIALAALAASIAFASPARSADIQPDTGIWAKERFQIRLRAIDLSPQESSSTNIGGHVNVTSTAAPEVDLSYYFTNNISAEIIAATTKHKMTHSSGAYLGSAWVLPPTATLQYHFTPHEAFSPYVGAGLNYTIFYDENAGPAFNRLKMRNSVGYALQAGADYWINANWGLNLDVKKIFLNTDAKLNGGAVRADVDLDPWVFGTGISYRF